MSAVVCSDVPFAARLELKSAALTLMAVVLKTADRKVEVARRIRALIDRTGARLSELRLEELVDPRDIRVRVVEGTPDTRRPSPLVHEGDLVVSAPRSRAPGVTPPGPFEDRSPLSLVLRLESGRFTVVALEL